MNPFQAHTVRVFRDGACVQEIADLSIDAAREIARTHRCLGETALVVSQDDPPQYVNERTIYSALRMASTRPDWPRPGTGVRNIECARDAVRARAVFEALRKAMAQERPTLSRQESR